MVASVPVEHPRLAATIKRARVLTRFRWSRSGTHKPGAGPVIRRMDLFDSIVAAHGQLRGLCRLLWAVMKNQQLVRRERQLSVGLTFVV